jgi:hypothetical protein
MTGPFVVKELEPCGHCEGGGEVWGEDPDTGLPDEPGLKSRCGRCAGEGARVVSVKAFETLEEARDHAEQIVLDRRDRIVKQAEEAGYAAGAKRAWDAAYWPLTHARSLPADGGSVSLPDGREITVEQTSYEALAEAIGWGDAYRAGTFTDAHALAYFNFEAEHPCCACGARALDRNHLACAACIERACKECPVLDTVAVRFVKGYVAERYAAQEGKTR